MQTSRRGFFATLTAAAAGFSILPAATTYTRLWKAVKPTPKLIGIPNPEYANAPYERMWFVSESQLASGPIDTLKALPLVFDRDVPGAVPKNRPWYSLKGFGEVPKKKQIEEVVDCNGNKLFAMKVQWPIRFDANMNIVWPFLLRESAI